MNLIRRYLMVILVGISLLFGIQIPNFLDQYVKRIDAHLREAAHNLQRYQEIADRYHSKSLYSLIASHKDSDNPSFRAEGLAIEDAYNRERRFKAAKLAIQDGVLWNAVHVVMDGDRELLKETMNQYSYAVPLNRDAITSGAVLSVAAIFMVELLFALLGTTVRRVRKHSRNKHKLDHAIMK